MDEKKDVQNKKSIKELRQIAHMTQREFSEYFGIPARTIEDWEGNRRQCNNYLLDLIYYKLKNEKMIDE